MFLVIDQKQYAHNTINDLRDLVVDTLASPVCMPSTLVIPTLSSEYAKLAHTLSVTGMRSLRILRRGYRCRNLLMCQSV